MNWVIGDGPNVAVGSSDDAVDNSGIRGGEARGAGGSAGADEQKQQ